MTISIQEPIPSGLFIRCFSKDEHAESFFNGNLRAGWLNKYKNMEGDVRDDTSEGESRFTHDVHGIECTTSGSSLNLYYIICISEVSTGATLSSEIHNLRTKFSGNPTSLAKYVRIHDLRRFTETLVKTLEASEYGDCIAEVKWYKVEYSKGEERKNPDQFEELELYQKPKESPHGKIYTDENEWRLAIRIKNDVIMEGRECNKLFTISEEEFMNRVTNFLHMTEEEINNYPHSPPEELIASAEPHVQKYMNDLIVDSIGDFSDSCKLCD